MINIDFLPERYRQHNANRRKRIWRFAVVGMFAAALIATAVFQFLSGRRIERRLAAVQLEYTAAEALNERLAELQRQLSKFRERARLITLLHHRWPTTQLLARVVNNVPDSITLSRIEFVSVSNSERQPKRRTRQRTETQQPTGPLAREDFRALSEAANQKKFVLRLVGTADKVAELHSYVALLGADRLFTAADLSSLAERDFTIRLTVKAGYGLLDGPGKPATAIDKRRPQHPNSAP